MEYQDRYQKISNSGRQEFLKELGIVGTLGGWTLSEVGEIISGETAKEFASIGQAIQADLTGILNAQFLASQREKFAVQASALSTVVEQGLPIPEVRTKFESVATAGRPVYEHIGKAGFFESNSC